MTKNKKKLGIIIIALVLVGGGSYHFLAGGNSGGAPGMAPAAGGPPGGFSVKVEATKAESGSLTQKIKVTGTLISNESVVISSEIAGRITAIPFKEGEDINKGDLMFKLDDSVQKAALAQAQANFALAQNNVNRYGGLVNSGAISKVQYEQSQADLALASANIELAKANLAKTTIRAPFSGVAGIRQVSIGDVVTNGQNLANLEQMSPIRVQFKVAEKYLPELKNNQKILIGSESYPDDKFEAEVFAIDPRVDMNTRSVTIHATSPNKDKKLFSGQFVAVTLPLKQSDNVVVIPDQALIPSSKGTSVFTVVNGKAKANPVTVGMRTDSKAEILSGLQAGDMVVTAGHQKIHEGADVRVAEPTPVTVTPPAEEVQKVSKE